ncbi:MAG TPA: hypothetical protein VIT45_09140 [Allosphingosinicella sp.]
MSELAIGLRGIVVAGMMALSLAAAMPVLAAAGEGEAIEGQAKALVAAIDDGSAADLQALVGDRVLLRLPGRNNQHRTTPEAMLQALRGCAHHLTKRFPGDAAEIFVLYVCRELPRGDILEEEEPGYVLRLWHHSLGVAVAYAPGGVQVRPITRTLTMPRMAPPAKPLPVEAEAQADAAKRFVAMVKAGQDAKASEFSETVSAIDAGKLKAIASCEPDPPSTSDGGDSVIIMWKCPEEVGSKSVVTLLSFAGGKVDSIFVLGSILLGMEPVIDG